MTDPLMAQFLEEGDELLDALDRGLLALERDPDDRELVNEVFRAAHTLKGASGLFELGALTSLTHAAEDVLDTVREGALVPGPTVIDALTAAFDVTRAWLAALGEHEVLPAGAGTVAAPHVAALRALVGTAAGGTRGTAQQSTVEQVTAQQAGTSPGMKTSPAWLTGLDAGLLARAGEEQRRGTTVHAVHYLPDPGCFFRGEDPLLLVRQVPDLLALVISARRAWPPLDELDEYDCALHFTLLTTAPAAQLEHLFRYVADEVETVVLGKPATVTMPAPIAALVAAQRQMLAAPFPPDQLPSRLASAVAVLRGALCAAGIPTDALTTAAEAATAAGDVGPLQALLDELLPRDGAPAGAPAPPGVPAPPGMHGPAAQPAGAPAPDASPAIHDTGSTGRCLKVDQTKIDRMLELAGELVVAKNALPFLALSAEKDYGLLALSRQIKDQYAVLDRLAQEMQHAVMDVRMLPVSVAFARFPRLVRDLSRRLGKQVRLVTEGEETAADKDVLELIGEPLLHLVRNSIDHGIELPADRVAAGKPPEATLRLSASQEADAVVVHVHDDGRGVDAGAVRQKAYERGLVDEERLEALSDRGALDLLFLPGFSTAEQVSDISGRGVGLDVVRSTVRDLGGDVSIDSEPGQGTTVRLRLPLTMAITRIMTVSAGGQRFGVALDHVRETVRARRSDLTAIVSQEAILLRDRLVPLVHLSRTLDIGGGDIGGADIDGGEVGKPSTSHGASAGGASAGGASAGGASAGGATDGDTDQEDLSVLVVRPRSEDIGLVVDRVHESIDVVLKPMEGVLAGARRYAGTALLGDGQVLLVLNLKELISDAARAG
jgi:two-component system chemotaxis sensor kinase CheA